MCNQELKTAIREETNGRRTVPCGRYVRRIRIFALPVCVFVCLLCGCTRREQLVLETGNTQVIAEAEGTGEDENLGGDVPAGGNRTAQAHTAAGNGQDTAGPGTLGEETQGQPCVDNVQKPEQAQQQEEYSGGNATICVHVCGAVKNAGVYELPAGSRVFEAVREAGGFTAEADESYVNQAQQLADGAKLVIPTVEQVQNEAGDGRISTGQIGIVEQDTAIQTNLYGVSAGKNDGYSEAGPSSDGKTNINTASEAQLCEIPGIGATRAAAIVAYREQSGGFNSIEDIMNVSGIKEGTYAKIKDKIKVN